MTAMRKAARVSSCGLAHRPADDLAAEQVEDRRRIQPTLAGADIGHIREPDLVRAGGLEVARQQIRGRQEGMMAVGRAAECSATVGLNAVPAHQALDAASSHPPSLSPQGGVHTWAAVATIAVGMDALHLGQQLTVSAAAVALGPTAPSVVAGWRDVEDRAHPTHREDRAVLLDEAELHLGAPEKMPMAFLRNDYAGDGASWST
jgi:hypothetical protein